MRIMLCDKLVYAEILKASFSGCATCVPNRTGTYLHHVYYQHAGYPEKYDKAVFLYS